MTELYRQTVQRGLAVTLAHVEEARDAATRLIVLDHKRARATMPCGC